MKKPSTKMIASMKTSMPVAPPGTIAKASWTIRSPPRPRNDSANTWEQIRMKNIMAVMRAVEFTTSTSVFIDSLPATAATRIDPTAPIEAASVGAATPPMIEPSTASTSAMGGKPTFSVFIHSSRRGRACRSASGIGGTMAGLNTPTSRM